MQSQEEQLESSFAVKALTPQVHQDRIHVGSGSVSFGLSGQEAELHGYSAAVADQFAPQS
jgi:hypothetical protein